MSFKALLKHRITVQRLQTTALNGSPVSNWVEVASDIRCFLDLNFIRKGKDPYWSESAGRPADRTGVLFLLPNAPIKSGDRVKVTHGPSGAFTIEGAIDEAWTPNKLHHLEVGVKEVAAQVYHGQYSQEHNV